ncbi:hypothetical protein AN958_10725, partial [Leucoagaricus sp. SymC.cos]
VMRASPNSDMAVVWINIWDSQSGTWAKQLINCKFNFGNNVTTVHACNMHPDVPQCQNCWRCAKCNGPHKIINHHEMARCCKANPKANSPRVATALGKPCPHSFKYINCKGSHGTDDRQCSF